MPSSSPSKRHHGNEHAKHLHDFKDEDDVVGDLLSLSSCASSSVTDAVAAKTAAETLSVATATARQQSDDDNNDDHHGTGVDIEFLVVQNNGVKVLHHHNDFRRKGRVMVAARDFSDTELYSVVLSDRPALICRANDTADFMQQFVDASVDVQCAILDMYHPTPIDSTPLGRALAEPAAVLSVLFADYGYADNAAFIQKLLCIWMMNAHDYFDNMTALFLMGSKINHSCCPNVGYTCRRREEEDDGADDGILEYRLLKPIAKGEEIVFSYLSDLYETPTLERRALLLESKWFLCQCERCNGPDYCRIMNMITTNSTSKRSRTIACTACYWKSSPTATATQTASRTAPRRSPCRYDDDYNPSWTQDDASDYSDEEYDKNTLIACPKCGASTSWTCSDDETGNHDTTANDDDANAVLVASEQAMEERLLQYQETMERLVTMDPSKIDNDDNSNNAKQEKLPSVQVLKGVAQESSTQLSPLHYLTLKAQLLYMVACASQKTLQIQYLQQQQQQLELQQEIDAQQHGSNSNSKKITGKRGNPKKIKDKINNNKTNDMASKKTIMSSEMEMMHHPSVYTVALQGCKAGFALVMAAECLAAKCTGCFPGHWVIYKKGKGIWNQNNNGWSVAASVVFRHEPLWDRAVCMLDICTDLCQLPPFCWPWYAVTLTQRYMPILRAKFGSSSKQLQEIQKVLIDPWRDVENGNNKNNTIPIVFCRECTKAAV